MFGVFGALVLINWQEKIEELRDRRRDACALRDGIISRNSATNK